MRNIRIKYILVSMLCLLTAIVHAETIYVIDELKIGLHEDRSIDSPIMKLVPSGTPLSVIERDNDLVHVQEPEGIRGWINSKYVNNEIPDQSLINELENKNKVLQKENDLLKSHKTTTAADTTSPDNKSDALNELEQQLKSERLKAGELQAQLTDLKSNIADIDNSDQFLNDIKALTQENQHLISQLESSGIEVQTESNSMSDSIFTINNWKNLTIAFVIVFVIGMVGGAFFLDFQNRRRHGGFRV